MELPTSMELEDSDSSVIHIEQIEIKKPESSLPKTETSKTQVTRLNVLFLVSDDLRPQLESYKGIDYPNSGTKLNMYTPNLDRLAKKSLQMDKAYVQFSVCCPSRASYMTSRRPDTTQVWDLTTFWREAGGNFTTIPQYFKERGYRTAGFGKIYHPGKGGGNNDVPMSWTEPYYHEPNGLFYQVINNSWWAVPEELSAAKPLHDEGITTAAIELLEELAPEARYGKQPFFVAIGFQKPHIPFVFPERYLVHYPLMTVDLAPNPYAPVDFPTIAWFHIEGSNYDDIKATGKTGITLNETLPDDAAMLYRRAYFSCISFVDDMVGRLLKALDNLELTENTIVTFIGDHGFHLGENGMWGKHTNMEQATHAPLMIHVPGRTSSGMRSKSIAEFVDLFPTIVEAAGLDPIPPCPESSRDVHACTEGRSFVHLFGDSERAFKDFAFSQISRGTVMGYAVRDAHYRYVEWVPTSQNVVNDNECVRTLDWQHLVGRELYDHLTDPEENKNIAEDNTYEDVVSRLKMALRKIIKSRFEVKC